LKIYSYNISHFTFELRRLLPDETEVLDAAPKINKLHNAFRLVNCNPLL